MGSTKKYYKSLDLIRVIACFAVLFYHLNILKGGYLAVCTFFVLSGYLSLISLFRKEKISLWEYYKNRFLKLYLPLIVVVFLAIFVTSFFSESINWINLKPETTSVLLGYNNFWQLGANLDYFARHIDSPFMHFWYIAILLQFDLILPFIYIPLRKLGDKISKKIPCIITFLLSILGFLIFLKSSYEDSMMVTYYHTLTRVAPLFFGLFLGFFHSYYKSYIPKLLKKEKNYWKVLAFYLVLLIILFVITDSQNALAPFAIIAVTLLSVRLIDYATIYPKSELSFIDKCINFLSSISYNVYLFQYPIIFIFQLFSINIYLKTILVIVLTLILSYLLKIALDFTRKNKVQKIFHYILLIIFLFPSLYGAYQYVTSQDHTEELKALEDQLAKNKEMMLKKQEEYQNHLKEEQENWNETLKNLENGEQELKEKVRNMPVVAVGDSIMLGALDNLYTKFPNGYFDAETSRTAWVANDVLQNLKNNNMLNGPVILNLGSNGDCPLWCKLEILETCGSQDVFWVNVVNDYEVHVNSTLEQFAKEHENVHIIDWNSISSGHYEYFVADRIHLTETGKKAYSDALYDSIYNYYLDKYSKKKEEIINQHEKDEKEKITFFGNDLLLNAFQKIHESFPTAQFLMDKDLNEDMLVNKIKEEKDKDNLNYKIVIALDNSISIDLDKYKELLSLLKDYKVYIVVMKDLSEEEMLSLEELNARVIDFYSKIVSNDDYLMVDKIHLTEKGNDALNTLLSDTLKID